VYQEDENTQSRSFFYVAAGILCVLLTANVAVFDLYALWFWIQVSGVKVS
jgi:hypothetical protein